MIKLMEMPKWLENPSWWDTKCTESYFTATQIRNKFWDSDKWKGPYIPSALSEKNWKPEEGKLYKCWWYYTNPSDPTDPGKDILAYIEGMDDDDVERMREEYIGAVEEMMKKMSLEGLKNLVKMMK